MGTNIERHTLITREESYELTRLATRMRDTTVAVVKRKLAGIVPGVGTLADLELAQHRAAAEFSAFVNKLTEDPYATKTKVESNRLSGEVIGD